MRRRPAAVAGTFYPGDRDELSTQLGGFLGAARERVERLMVPKAIIAPHAGTVYSGPVAASAYVHLEPLRDTIERVVLCGPAHRVAVAGVAASSAEAFSTPLGDIPVDRAALSALVDGLDHVSWHDEAHRQEHSLELHLPFLQLVLARFTLVPLLVGRASADEVAAVLDRLWGGPETLVIASSDLSHFHDYDTARRLDLDTSGIIERLAHDELDADRACGFYPLRGLLQVARARGLCCTAVDVRSSGDTAGPRRQVVGYGSYLLS